MNEVLFDEVFEVVCCDEFLVEVFDVVSVCVFECLKVFVVVGIVVEIVLV